MNLQQSEQIEKGARAVSKGAIYLTTGVAVYGAIGVYGFDSVPAIAASSVIVAATYSIEVGASKLLVYAQRKADAGRKVSAALIAGVFLGCTAVNIAAAHHGLKALDAWAIADKRAPYEQTFRDARADKRAADAAVVAFDKAVEAKATNLAIGLKGAMAAGYVGASARALNCTSEACKAAADKEKADRLALVEDQKAADKAFDAAKDAMANAPQGRADAELWTMAVMLEILKGFMIWAATAVAGKVARATVEKPYEEMTVEELQAAASAAGRAQRLIGAEKKRRQVPRRAA